MDKILIDGCILETISISSVNEELLIDHIIDREDYYFHINAMVFEY